MNTILVWVLYLSVAGHPIVIDNIATEKACKDLGNYLSADPKVATGRESYVCRPVEKVKA